MDIILSDIKKDLIDLKINHDNFVSEKKISSLDNINKLKNKLLDLKLAYFGFQAKPKNLSMKTGSKKSSCFFALKNLVTIQIEH